MVDQLTESLQNETAQLQSKEQELQLKKQMNDDNNHMKLLIEDMKLNHEKEMNAIKARLDSIKMLNDSQSKEDEMAFKIAEKQQGHQNEMENVVLSKSLEGSKK